MSDIEVPVGQVIDLNFTIRDQDGLVVDVSAATEKTITLKKIGAAVASKTLAFTDDGTDGEVEYTTLATDLDAPGTWKVQAVVTIATVVYRTNVITFTVVPNL